MAYLIENGKQSQTVKSYISAIKAVLKDNNIEVNEDVYLLHSLTKSCKLNYNCVRVCRPIQKEILSILLKAVECYFDYCGQLYLWNLYMAMFAAAYYGLFRIGEIAEGKHLVKDSDMHLAMNKRKLLFILRSLKTHDVNVEPQSVKIASTKMKKSVTKQMDGADVKQFCPCHLIQTYLAARGKYYSSNESFFILPDHSAVKQQTFRITLQKCLALAGFEVFLRTQLPCRMSPGSPTLWTISRNNQKIRQIEIEFHICIFEILSNL